MYRICICEDEPVILNRIRKKVEKYFADRNDVTFITYTDSEQLWSEQPEAQLYLFDVMMPGITGLELAGKLRFIGSNASIIFISSFNEPVFDSFQYQPLRYIRKEYLDDELPSALQAFMELQADANHSFPLITNGIEVLIPNSSFLYCESKGHYITFHCKNREYEVRGKLSDYKRIIKNNSIVQPNKSFLVNMRYISLFSCGKIIMENGFVIPVTRTFLEEFKTVFMKYQRNYHYDNTI